MKTQSQINKRLRDYKNGVVDSPYRVKRWTSYDDALAVWSQVVLMSTILIMHNVWTFL